MKYVDENDLIEYVGKTVTLESIYENLDYNRKVSKTIPTQKEDVLILDTIEASLNEIQTSIIETLMEFYQGYKQTSEQLNKYGLGRTSEYDDNGILIYIGLTVERHPEGTNCYAYLDDIMTHQYGWYKQYAQDKYEQTYISVI